MQIVVGRDGADKKIPSPFWGREVEGGINLEHRSPSWTALFPLFDVCFLVEESLLFFAVTIKIDRGFDREWIKRDPEAESKKRRQPRETEEG